MGNFTSSIPPPSQVGLDHHTAATPDKVGGKRREKRRRHEVVDELTSSDEDNDVPLSPKRQRIQNTSAYIYETFFLKGTGSDVTIKALDGEWKLHKNYLKQSAYFDSMFSGRWLESDLSVIQLDIPDQNITTESLSVAFSSLYKDSVRLETCLIPSVIASATMLQLDGLLNHCLEFIRETINSDVITIYLKTASQYGLNKIKSECQFWLQSHLLTDYSLTLLNDMSLDMFTDLIKSPDLFVLQVEMDIYSLAKKWLFLQLHPSWSGDLPKLTSATEKYFRDRDGDDAFLDTEDGKPYRELFHSIRLYHILIDALSIAVLENDRIIPLGWLLPLYRYQWLRMISVDQRTDSGPSTMSTNEFDRSAVRCGRILHNSDEYCWRWTGFSFGIDILLTFNNGMISIKRNTHSQPCLAAVSLQSSRPLSFRLRVASFNESQEVCTSQDTGVVHLSLSPDETTHILTVNKQARFPLYISFNFALTSYNSNLAL